MQKLIVIAMILCVVPWTQRSWAGGGRKIDRCNGFLLAPADLKEAARTVLKIKPAKGELEAAKDQLSAYVGAAPLGSEQVLAFLKGLHHDAPPERGAHHTNFNYSLVNMYLMRPGNEALAAQNLETVIGFYWDDLIDYKTDPRQWDWLERQTQFIEKLTALYPLAMRQVWSEVTASDSKELVQYLNLNPILGATSGYLAEYMNWDRYTLRDDNEAFENGEPDAVKNRKRVEYTQWIVKELQEKVPQNDIASLKKLYVIRDPWFAENDTYGKDAAEFIGESLSDEDAAVVEVVFLARLARRLDLWTPEQKRFENLLKRIESLLLRYPRSAGGPGRIT